MKSIICLLALASTVCAAPAPYPVTINSRVQTAPGLQAYRANETVFRVTFTDGATASDLTNTVPFMQWATSNTAAGVSTSSYAFVGSTASGVVDFTFSQAAVNFTPGLYIYEAGILASGVPRTYRQGSFRIIGSPVGAGVPAISFTTNVNWNGITWVNLPDFATGTVIRAESDPAALPLARDATNRIAALEGAGYVTPVVTNGLASTGYVAAATADLVTSAVTNGLATTGYVDNATADLVTASVTNGLAPAIASGTWRNPQWFQLTWDQSPTNAPDSTTYRTNLDQLIERAGFNNVKHDRVAQVSEQHGFFNLAFDVAPTNLASVSSNGYLTHIADGVVTASVTAATFARTNLLVLRTEGGVIDRYSGGAAGSLRETVISNVTASVTNASMQTFSTYSPPTTFVRNTNLWIKPAPECLAAYNSTKGYYRGGVLITPRHAIAAAHYPPDVGDVMYWVDATNGVFSSTVAASTAVASDVQLIRLSTDVPVRRAKFLQDPEAALPTGIQKIPLALGEVHFGAPEFQLVVGETAAWSTGQYAMMSWWSAAQQTEWRALFRHYPVSGDSSQPVLFSTGTDFVLLFCLWYPTSGPNLHSYLTQIQAAITAGGDTNLIEYLDVSNYTEF